LDDQLLRCPARLVRTARVCGGVDAPELVTQGRLVEDDSQPGLSRPMPEIEILAAEQALTREARVEATDPVEGFSRDRHLTRQELAHGQVRARRRQPLATAFGPPSHAVAEHRLRRRGMEGQM